MLVSQRISGWCEEIDRVEVSRLCQKVENQFIGVNCGIMDQFAVCLGKKDNAILLDCNSLYYEYAPLKLGNYSLVIMNTNKRRELADSKYNERRGECEKALEIINSNKDEEKNLCRSQERSLPHDGRIVSTQNKCYNGFPALRRRAMGLG